MEKDIKKGKKEGKEDKVYRETVFYPKDLEIREEEVTNTWFKSELQKGKYVEASRIVLKVYPLIPTSKEEVTKMRLSSRTIFVYRNGEEFFYTELEKGTRIGLPSEAKHQCINCGRCYAHKCDKVGASPIESIIRNHTGNEQNIYVTRKCIDDDALKEMIKYSQRLEKYPFIKEGFEIFDNSPIYNNRGTFGNDGVRCLVVLECSDFVDDTCRRPKSQTDTKKDTDHYEGTASLSCMQETFRINSGRKKYSPPNY